MQKDVHFYLTYALARRVGIAAEAAETVAWANQFTDELTDPDLHEIQTQSAIIGNWGIRQIQLSVLAPFHFVPGGDAAHPWMTTRNSTNARALVRAAKGDLVRIGIALHALQDTFSHETFSGWQEELNSCYPWYYLKAAIPNVGHAEMRVIPDVANYVWTDPRSGKRIDNKTRTMSAAKATYNWLVRLFGLGVGTTVWKQLKPRLRDILKLDSYDRRVDQLCILSGDSEIDYRTVTQRFEATHRDDFVQAACGHLAKAMDLFGPLPRTA